MNMLLKALMGVVAAVLFFGGMSYIPDPYGTYIWQGGALGALTVVAMFLVGAPVAFMMNRYAYKPFVSRLIMGIIGLVAFPIILGLMFFRPKTYYFGLMPLVGGCGAGTGGNSLIDYLYAIWCTVIEPVAFYTNESGDTPKLQTLLEEAAGYGENATLMSAGIITGGINTARIADPNQWAEAYTAVENELMQQTPNQ